MHSHCQLSVWVWESKVRSSCFHCSQVQQSIPNPCFFSCIVFYSLQVSSLSSLEYTFVIVDCLYKTVTAQLSLYKFSLSALADQTIVIFLPEMLHYFPNCLTSLFLSLLSCTLSHTNYDWTTNCSATSVLVCSFCSTNLTVFLSLPCREVQLCN